MPDVVTNPASIARRDEQSGRALCALAESKIRFAQTWMRALPNAPDLVTAAEAVGIVRGQLGRGRLLLEDAERITAGPADDLPRLRFSELQEHWVHRITALWLITELTCGVLEIVAARFSPSESDRRWAKLLEEEAEHAAYACGWLRRFAVAGGNLQSLTLRLLEEGGAEAAGFLETILGESAPFRDLVSGQLRAVAVSASVTQPRVSHA